MRICYNCMTIHHKGTSFFQSFYVFCSLLYEKWKIIIHCDYCLYIATCLSFTLQRLQLHTWTHIITLYVKAIMEWTKHHGIKVTCSFMMNSQRHAIIRTHVRSWFTHLQPEWQSHFYIVVKVAYVYVVYCNPFLAAWGVDLPALVELSCSQSWWWWPGMRTVHAS